MLLNVLQFMRDLQHPSCEPIDVFDKVSAHGNFILYVVSSTDGVVERPRLFSL
jgi:hypothetical protein